MSETRTVVLTTEFEYKDGRISAIGGSVELSGIHTSIIVDTTLGVLEELVMHELADMPPVQELIGWQVPLGDETYPLEEDTQLFIVKLLAHQLLLGRVASRRYVTRASSSRLSLPHDG